MFVTLTNRTDKKQTTVAEYKLFALKNNVYLEIIHLTWQ